MHILVTGGAGFIGSHTCVALLEAGHSVVALDNLCNSTLESIKNIERITGKSVPFRNVDIAGGLTKSFSESFSDGLTRVFSEPVRFDAVVHCAGLKAVGESVENPLEYYHNNVTGTVNLLRCMDAAGCRRLIFSSSATVYAGAQSMPVSEDEPNLRCANPYGRTKLHIERMLQDLGSAWEIVVLRYFNPVGAHPSGLLGENPTRAPNNLMPVVAQVATGARDSLSVFGNDYETADGTAVRDYIHVVDLANGHVAALERGLSTGCNIFNLGTGGGHSVLEVVRAYERASGRAIKAVMAPRRTGDVAEVYANPNKARELLGWEATKRLDDMCADDWRWQTKRSKGE